MALKVTRVDTWAVTIEDRPGGLAAKLRALADGKANLEFVIARRAPDRPGTGVAFVTPIAGAAQRAAKQAGFAKSASPAHRAHSGPGQAGRGGSDRGGARRRRPQRARPLRRCHRQDLCHSRGPRLGGGRRQGGARPEEAVGSGAGKARRGDRPAPPSRRVAKGAGDRAAVDPTTGWRRALLRLDWAGVSRPLPVSPAHGTLRAPRSGTRAYGHRDRRRRHRRAHPRARPAPARHPLPRVRGRAGGERAGRGHHAAAARHARADRARPRRGAGAPGHRKPRELLLQPLRPAHLRRAARPGRGLPGPRGGDPSRPAAPGPVARRGGAARRGVRPRGSPVRWARPE